MATTFIQGAQSLFMVPTMPWLGPGELQFLKGLNPCKIMTTRWSVYSTKCLATIIYSFYHLMKPNMPYSNFMQGETYHAGHPFNTEQVPGRYSPDLPGAGPNQDDAASEWRFRAQACSASRPEEDESHLTYGDEAYDGGGSIFGHGPNHPRAGFGGTPAPGPQPLQNSDYSMVSVFHQMSSDGHLILPSHEAKYSILQQPQGRTLLRRVPLRASPRPFGEFFAPPSRGGLQSKSPFRMALPYLLSAILTKIKSI